MQKHASFFQEYSLDSFQEEVVEVFLRRNRNSQHFINPETEYYTQNMQRNQIDSKSWLRHARRTSHLMQSHIYEDFYRKLRRDSVFTTDRFYSRPRKVLRWRSCLVKVLSYVIDMVHCAFISRSRAALVILGQCQSHVLGLRRVRHSRHRQYPRRLPRVVRQ